MKTTACGRLVSETNRTHPKQVNSPSARKKSPKHDNSQRNEDDRGEEVGVRVCVNKSASKSLSMFQLYTFQLVPS